MENHGTKLIIVAFGTVVSFHEMLNHVKTAESCNRADDCRCIFLNQTVFHHL